MSNYEIPDWAGKPSAGLHLDVLKDSKLIQKLMIDEKRAYLFGRNPHLNDFCIDHGSCSRVHAALVYHKHLDRSFLVDLGSTHGTFIGKYRIESEKPIQLPVDSTFHFGESTRRYILRERPQSHNRPIMEELEKGASETDGGLLGLPETETELDNLTEFNTAHNRRISMMGINKDDNYVKKRRKIRITFNEDEEVINPEDVDPSIGRFRNMVTTMVVPNKRQKVEVGYGLGSSPPETKRHMVVQSPGSHAGVARQQGLYDDVEAGIGFSATLSSTLGLSLPNPAPDIDMGAAKPGLLPGSVPGDNMLRGEIVDPDEPKKKKYAKEAWPGRKPGPALF